MKWGESFSSQIAKKVVAVPGDISYENLGIQDPYLRDLICREVDIFINLAATVNFYERYDVALDTNTFGAMNVLNLAKKCLKCKVILHVSTAYVCKESSGIILEESLWCGASCLDIDEERKVAYAKLKELHDANADPKATRSAMKDLGNHRTLDSVIVPYGKGKLKWSVGDPETIIDLIPGDMVVNCILAAITAHATAHESTVLGHHIYHVGSSRRIPLKLGELMDFIQSYFIKKPWVRTGSGGNGVKVEKVKMFDDMNKFREHIFARYWLFLKVLKFLNIVGCQHFDTIERKINFVTRFSDLYLVYMFFRVAFDDANTKKLLQTISNDSHSFNFEVTCFDWKEYIMNIHIPGVVQSRPYPRM